MTAIAAGVSCARRSAWLNAGRNFRSMDAPVFASPVSESSALESSLSEAPVSDSQASDSRFFDSQASSTAPR
ncbi:hypothetical protein [Oxalicibacterium solurbis]|uniref:hypothetical protein n=1 Tax=Oxalicibacterium solurbis TaxID=69280 RepID=UPI0016630CEC|nr:hypothetical protein [Oxalicibacterium solurbis]